MRDEIVIYYGSRKCRYYIKESLDVVGGNDTKICFPTLLEAQKYAKKLLRHWQRLFPGIVRPLYLRRAVDDKRVARVEWRAGRTYVERIR